MAICGSDQDKARLVARLSRIEGQLRGLRKMVAEDDSCVDVLRQVAAASGALKGVWMQILEDHLHGCVHRAVLDGGKDDELVHELVRHIKKLS
jgi:DNA-binding FrmR family transcriptional regulator